VSGPVEKFRIQKGGRVLALAPRAFDVLAYLIEHRERAVDKQELFTQIWKDTFVTDNALTRAVKEVRRVVGDDADSPRYLETIPKRGYRFIAELRDAPVGVEVEASGTGRDYVVTEDAPHESGIAGAGNIPAEAGTTNVGGATGEGGNARVG